ncbi:hypothetical protein [Raoultibacter phocaeensis]|uniref:hypothetical protein n=1 Tax=Raoultibacter phocaeensis TaxID=2479841 RepID=UPI0011195973|nr:hypothetical protein [Raoultibacter phocaeensis]
MAEGGSPRWWKIDRIEIANYPYLCTDDLCYYYLERSHGTWKESEANRIVSNFQRSVTKYHDRADVLCYKDNAIRFFAERIANLIAKKKRACPLVIVPMVTSKPKSHCWYDDRLVRTAQTVASLRPGEVAVCDILDVVTETSKAKLGGSRNPEEIERNLDVGVPDCPEAEVVFLIDDVITTGGHFAACRNAIRPLFPKAKIVGVFLARQKSGYEYSVVEFPYE